mmetsp:Transcript_15148/g.33630  ORF Transcript_15148/g.33630 Transcript_15148/m.33630 type:complete len:80 (-) Transcript_15148:968-1207(-)
MPVARGQGMIRKRPVAPTTDVLKEIVMRPFLAATYALRLRSRMSVRLQPETASLTVATCSAPSLNAQQNAIRQTVVVAA